MTYWMRAGNTFNIFIADDNRAYHRVMKSAWHEMNPQDKLYFVSSGRALIEQLTACQENPLMPQPDMILLDLQMPHLDGKETLTAIRSDLGMKLTPIIMLTCSPEPDDIQHCYRMSCSSYLVKPEKYQDLVDSFDQLRRFYFEVSKVPSRQDAASD